MQRITLAHVQAVITRINNATNSPLEPYTQGSDGRHHANIGNYHLSRAYGGYSLHRMCNEGGGVSDVFSCGHVPARDLCNRMFAMLSGLYARSMPNPPQA